jgi:NADH:ubiquinone oxidoreductase subunit H
MDRNLAKIIALVGAAILAVGVFLPVVQVPKRGAMTLMDLESAGVIILVLAAIAAGVALIGWTRHAVWPGIGALGLLAYAYQRTNAEIAQSRARLSGGIGEDPLAALRDLAASNSRVDYGWSVLAVGALIVVVAGVLAWRLERRPPEERA